jgi:thioredoxin
MKKSWFWLAAILMATAISCNGQTERTKGKNLAINQDKLQPAASTGEVVNQAPVHITKDDFLKLIMNYEKNTENWVYEGEKPCLIDFYADWCAPCRITSPILEDLAIEYAGRINIYKVDIEKEQELAAVFGVQNIPTFLFCPMEGNPTISSGIANSPEATKTMFIKQIEELLLKGKNSSAI